MKITDGERTVIIQLVRWSDKSGYVDDISEAYFDAESLPYNPQKDSYTVEDVAECIDKAFEWESEAVKTDDSSKACITEFYRTIF